MVAKGANHKARKQRLTVAYCEASSRTETARWSGDWEQVRKLRDRMTALRKAWQRLDDHIYPNKNGAR